MKKIENLRTDYKLDQLNESSLASSPMVQFELWFNEVLDSIIEPTAMVLSTYSQKKGVNSRVVLLKELKKDGFVFYTNYNSLKAEQIKQNPYVSLLFFWPVNSSGIHFRNNCPSNINAICHRQPKNADAESNVPPYEVGRSAKRQ